MLEKTSALESSNDSPEISGKGFRFAVVASRWNDQFTSKLVEGAIDAFTGLGVMPDDVEVFRVPGAFELPLAALKAAQTGRFDAVAALGVVIRGDTPHFDFVAGEAARGISEVALRTGVPVLFGIITADTIDQVVERSGTKDGNKGYEAAMAAIEVANLYRKMGSDKQAKIEGRAFPHVV